MSVPYACVRDARYEIKEQAAGVVVDDIGMLRFLRMATQRIENKLGMHFIPYLDTKPYNMRQWNIDSADGVLTLPEAALSITAATDGNGNALQSTDFSVYPAGMTPITALQFAQSGLLGGLGWCKSWYSTLYCNGMSNTSVTALWGYHGDYVHAWINSLDAVQDNPLTTSATTITVTNAAGADEFGQQPRFSPGMLLRIEAEYMELVGVSGNSLIVRRGVNGTTAVAHIQSAPIYVYEVEPPIRQAALRWAVYPYKRRGDFARGNFNLATGEATTLPIDMPGEVAGILQEYANK